MNDHLVPAEQALTHIEQSLKNNKTVALFLDYDGTLSEIVPNPGDAKLTDGMRKVLEKLTQKIPVTILSGRDRADVQNLAGIQEAIYAGSHGFDITGPNNLQMQHEGGRNAQQPLREATESLHRRLDAIEGAWVERKKYAIAVHYRQVPDSQVGAVESIVKEELGRHPELKKGGGKKILELKPNIDWHKGRALEWLLDTLPLGNKEDVLAIFIGDDLTDEDALVAVEKRGNKGIGILVGEHGENSAATYWLKDVSTVQHWLEKLDQLLA